MGICNLMMVVVMVMAVVVVEQGKYAGAKNMLLLARNRDLRKVDLQLNRPNSKPLPIPNLKNVESVEYDTMYGYVYWGQSGRDAGIYKARMNGKGKTVVVSSDALTFPKSLAIDKKTRILYFADADRDTIESITLNETPHRKLIVRNAGFSNSMVISSTGYIYWTSMSPFEVGIKRATKDGKNVERIVGNLDQPCCLVIDSTAQRLYWGEINKAIIKVSGLRGEEPTTVFNMTSISALAVVGNYLYFADFYNGRVDRILKTRGSGYYHSVVADRIPGLVDMKAFEWDTGDDIVIHGQAAKEDGWDGGDGTSETIIVVAVIGAVVDIGIAVVLTIYFRSKNAGAGGRGDQRPNM